MGEVSPVKFDDKIMMRFSRWNMHSPLLMKDLTADEFRFWYVLCCMTNPADRSLPDIDTICFNARLSPEIVEQMLAKMISLKLVVDRRCGPVRTLFLGRRVFTPETW